jgi:hypothetical protein
MVIRRLFLAFGALLLTACATSGGVKERAQALDHLQQLQFADAQKDLTGSDVLADSKNRLLTLMELGTVAHYQGLFEKSNIYFFKAKDVFRQLYTSSLREQLATGLLNDNSASYVGMDYEISMVHYFIVSNFLALSESSQVPAWEEPAYRLKKDLIMPEMKGEARALSANDRVDYLSKARSELLDWNAFLGEVRESNRGQPYYKDDLLNKVFAAYVHRIVGGDDRNIADLLYKDARDVLVRAYCAYPTYNSEWQKFVDNYKKFPEMGVEAVKQKFIRATPAYAGTESQINLAAKKNSNFLMLLELGEIPKRVEHRYVIGLSTVLGQIEDPALRRQIEQLGMQVILQMAPAFGLTAITATVVGAATGHDAKGGNPKYMSEALDSAIGFEFKLPQIEDYPAPEATELRLKAAAGSSIQIPVAVMSPLGDIAKLNVERRATAVALKTGLRVGAKYVAALIPAILMYKKLEGKPDFVRMLAASAVWMAGKKVADATEEADLRAWNSLPRWVGTAEAKVAPGTYQASLVARGEKGERETPLGTLTVAADGSQQLWQARVFSSGKAVLH